MPYSTTTQFQAIDGLVEAVIAVNTDGIIEFANQAMVELFGYTKVELIGHNLNILIPDTHRSQHFSFVDQFFKQTSSRRMADGRYLNGRHKNGKLVPIEVSLSPFTFQDKQLVLALIVDASRKLDLITEARTSEAFYKSLIDNNHDHIFKLDKHFNIEYINHVSPGLIKEEVLGANLLDIIPPQERERIEQILIEAFTTGEVVIYDLVYPSPKGQLHYSTTVTPIKQNGVVVGANLITKDETQLLSLQGKLKTQYLFTEKVMDSALNGIYIYDLRTGQNTYINSQYTDILGYTLEDIRSMPAEEFMELFHPDDREVILEHMKVVSELRPGEIDTITYRFRAKQGQWVWCHSRDSGFEYDNKGKLVSFVGSFVDVTDLKVANEQLKMQTSEMEQFVYMATHDLKSPLSSIQQVLDEVTNPSSTLPDDKKMELLQRSQETSKRLVRMVTSLLDFAKHSVSQDVERVDMNVVLPNVLRDLTADINRSNALVKFGKLPVINAYMPHIAMMFQNLIQNAIKYSSPERSPVVDISFREQLDHYLFIVQDNGKGIEEKNLEEIFNIFTKIHSIDGQTGNGIGLANCKRIATLHRGNIWAESEVDEGSTFFFTIAKQLN